MIESIEKPQESIRKNRTPTAVIPAQAGIQRRNATGIYRKKQNPPTAVIPAKAGIQQPKNHRNLSAKTETPPPSFPQKRESKNATQQESIGKNRNPTDRHSRKSWNPATEKPQESISKNRNPHRVIPAKAGIQKRNATGIYRKKQKPHRPSFPQKRESRPVGTESYRIKQFP
ncbi:hypothetical protein [Neisseria meningitidis]|uniref:Phage associated protein n=1 Tax=Neisseria meningitidis TaxID=487 RepID=A0AB33TYA8_NEIME|nr:hypothetical protein [Neisseria meningitidis]CWM66781.1 putative phage associated protein [Neisseria meningitidis]CWM73431.1 putative phage associated protein [Neisseria meningitidis]CWM75198.1 putative phage associated protein [Neisseria meningitidis]CWM98192.1 putative phage associated protein [Neisseria meningitidis]CWN01006.1 putative phage associated protein [Neisseria meningitidis]